MRSYIIRRAKTDFQRNKALQGEAAKNAIAAVSELPIDTMFLVNNTHANTPMSPSALLSALALCLTPMQAVEQLALIQRQSTIAGFYQPPEPSVMEVLEQRKRSSSSSRLQ